jgi:ribosome biogenesis protein MAK21
MGKKRTHAETKDGPARPAPDKSRVSATHDKKDARKNGEAKSRLNLVSFERRMPAD